MGDNESAENAKEQIEKQNTNEAPEYSKLSEEELKAKINELMDKEEAIRLKKIEALRKLHPQKVLSRDQVETLLSLKEEELTDADKLRIQWTTLRLKNHKYFSPARSKKKNKKAKLKRRMAKASRKANR
jgi:hypothetical protein